MEIETFESRLKTYRDEARKKIAAAETEDEAIKAKNEFLGREGKIKELTGAIGSLPDDEKPRAGRTANQVQSDVEEAYETRLEEIRQEQLDRQIEREAVDVTLPARDAETPSPHPIAEVSETLTDVFASMGFEVAGGPEIETDFYNFEALNFPKDHPARDMQDTFKLEDGRLLRTHTSPLQIRTMESYEPPIRIVAPGRVYRCDADLTHSPVFHQIEGLLVDEDVTFADLKGTLTYFAGETFGGDTPVRFRPSFFPFTEPSAEMDIGCIFCDGEGCRVCEETGWLEILGAGMVDPNVFEKSGVDPETYTGFAFGMGIERIAMLKRGIGDIRLFYDNDLRFLEQF